MLTFTGDDLDVMARTLYGEIRGGTFAAMRAVGWVIRNRAELDLGNDGRPDWWGEGIAGVCQKPYQFSCWNNNDPNRPQLMRADISMRPFRDCLAAAAHVLSTARSQCMVGWATHYFNPDVVTAPTWTIGARMVGKVGPHVFYANVK